MPMLFISAMDVLHQKFAKASRDGVLRPIPLQEIKFQCSLCYAWTGFCDESGNGCWRWAGAAS